MPSPALGVVERFVAEIVNGGRPESAPDLIASEPLRRRVAAFATAFPDLHARVVRIVGDERLVAVHLVAEGTHAGPFQGSPPTGRRWSSTCTAMYEVVDGQIADFWVNWDLLDILEQLGVVDRTAGVSA